MIKRRFVTPRYHNTGVAHDIDPKQRRWNDFGHGKIEPMHKDSILSRIVNEIKVFIKNNS